MRITQTTSGPFVSRVMKKRLSWTGRGRAECIERCPLGSEGGVRKRTRQSNAPCAYPTRRIIQTGRGSKSKARAEQLKGLQEEPKTLDSRVELIQLLIPLGLQAVEE